MSDWYREWAQHHCRTFGVDDERVVVAILSWQVPLIDYLRADEVELYEATRRCVVLDDPPRWPEEHLAAIKRHLAAQKFEAARRVEREADTQHDRERGVCTLCGDTGIVIVPHPQYASHSEWWPSHHAADGSPVRPTCGVHCRCGKGRRGFAAVRARLDGTGLSPGFTLERYLAVNFHWREQMERQEAACSAMTEAERKAQATTVEDLAWRLANRMKPPRAGA